MTISCHGTCRPCWRADDLVECNNFVPRWICHSRVMYSCTPYCTIHYPIGIRIILFQFDHVSDSDDSPPLCLILFEYEGPWITHWLLSIANIPIDKQHMVSVVVELQLLLCICLMKGIELEFSEIRSEGGAQENWKKTYWTFHGTTFWLLPFPLRFHCFPRISPLSFVIKANQIQWGNHI